MCRWPLVFGAILLLAASACLSTPTRAQTDEPAPIEWQRGPCVADLRGYAQINVPEGFLFADKKGAQKLLELTHNPSSSAEVGAIVPAGEGENDQWFVIFEFNDIGFVKDDEKAALDATKLLETLKKGNDEANKERRKKGWGTIEIVGWDRDPYYDQSTQNLTWAIRGRNDQGGESVNHSVRILGRRGTMNVDLVLGPDQYAAVVPSFDQMLAGFSFNSGHRYADFIPGDKVASYGLTALIAGGAGVAAVKSGLLATFGKLIVGLLLAAKKLIIVLILAAGAFVRAIWGAISGRKKESTAA